MVTKNEVIIILIILLSVIMFGFGKKKNSLIEVKFIENGQESAFAVSDVPIEQLPDTFEIDTTLDIGNEKWSIANAIPQKKQDFIKTGKLSLYLSKIEMMNPKNILFSLPTINDEIGLISDAMKENDQYYKIYEDDWRQIELISNYYEEAINKELNSISKILNNSKQEFGFQKIHVRKEITNPLYNKNISLTQLKNHFDFTKEFRGVFYDRQTFGIKNSYAFLSKSGVVIWGEYLNDGSVRSICFSLSKPDNVEEFISMLIKLIEEQKLYFVDWCRVQKINNYKLLVEYFSE